MVLIDYISNRLHNYNHDELYLYTAGDWFAQLLYLFGVLLTFTVGRLPIVAFGQKCPILVVVLTASILLMIFDAYKPALQ